MPERSSVKAYCDFLQSVVGCQLLSIRNHTKRHQDLQQHLPLTVTAVKSKGKFMWWELTNGSTNYTLYNEPVLGGTWSETPQKGVEVTFVFDSRNVYYLDLDWKKLSKLSIQEGNELVDSKLQSLGPDLLDDQWTVEQLPLQRKQRWSVGKVMLDQSVVAGIGNFIKCDSLYLAGIHPNTAWKDLSPGEQKNVYEMAKKVAWEAYRHGGRYGGDGYKHPVYGRTVDEDGNEVIKLKTKDGRQSYICPSKQNQ